jgi:ABC-2 type transport system permease protein
MRNIILVAKREYLEQIRGRAFKISTVAMPLLIAALLAFSHFMEQKAGKEKHIEIVAQDAPLANEIRKQLLDNKWARYKAVDVIAPATDAQRAEGQNLVKAKSIDGLLTLDTSNPDKITASFTSLSAIDIAANGSLQSALNRAAVNQRMIRKGMTAAEAEALLAQVSIDSLQIDKDNKLSKNNGGTVILKASLMLVMLSVPIMLYGLDMARAIIEEKTSRIFEVMLAVAKPSDLLAGKLLGVGGVGITQITIWVVGATLFMGTQLAASILTGNIAIRFSWAEGIFFPVYFVLGFVLFSAIFSGLAATCETAQDLQKFMWVAIVPLYTSLGLLPVMISDPNSSWSIAASLFPLTSPYVMISRMGMMAVPLWQVALSVLLLLLTCWATLWFSSRLYRVGILMYGKRATLPEIFRWLRYS